MKATSKDIDGTSFHETTIKCSVSTLRKILGEPEYEPNNGEDKINFEWAMETNDGDVFTVYDWKEGRPLNESDMIEWHIGGRNRTATEQAKSEIREAIVKSQADEIEQHIFRINKNKGYEKRRQSKIQR